VLDQVSNWNSQSRLTGDLIKELQRLAVNQVYRCAGYFRDRNVQILSVDHRPPSHDDVPRLIEEMCEYVHTHWQSSPIHLASYLMWRTNWIHPFFGGNGRTARALSYLILSARLGFVLPGTPSIPELIVARRRAYLRALEVADVAWKQDGRLDLTSMEDLLGGLLAEQLVAIHQRATGKQPNGEPCI
jgi:Fic family protein